MQNRGFTLIELLVVIAVISLLSSVIMTNINLARIKARNTQRIANAHAIANGFYIATTGTTNKFPSTVGLLPHPYVCLGKSSCWNGTYSNLQTIDDLLKNGMSGGTIPVDPFWKETQLGNAYTYGGFTSLSVIYWVMEDDGNPDRPCGRGQIGLVTVNDDEGYICSYYLERNF